MLSFLDVLLNNNAPHFPVTTTYRKKTFTGVLTNVLSFTSLCYKLGLVKSFIVDCSRFRTACLFVNWFVNKRGYNLSFLNQEIGRVNDITRSDALTNKDTPDTDQPTRVPLVITYNQALRSVSSIFDKHFNILSSSPRCANVFKATPLVAFRRTNNLSNLLVSAKIPNPTHNTPPHGSFLCRDNCLTCNYITDGRTSYTFHSTGETEHITHHIDCNSKNVIYMVHCNRCHKQYIRETKRRLKDRFNEHRRPVDKQTVLNLLQSRNIFFLTTITLLTCYLFLSNSSNLIVTVYAKLERHTSSIEVKLLNL